MNRLDVVPTQPQFRADGQVRRHGRAHRGDDLANAIGVLQECGAAVMAIDCSRGAAEIQVHRAGPGPKGGQGGLGQQIGVAAQQLDLDRKSCGGPASLQQLGYVPLEGALAGNRLADTKELRHAESEPAEFRQQGPHGRIRDALHRCQHDGRHAGLDPRGWCGDGHGTLTARNEPGGLPRRQSFFFRSRKAMLDGLPTGT